VPSGLVVPILSSALAGSSVWHVAGARAAGHVTNAGVRGLAAFVEIKQAVLRLSAPRHRRSTTPSAGPADGQWGKLLAVEPHGLFLMCGSTIRWGKPWGRAQLGTARHCSQQLA